ncbi:cell envelope integrity EipB family protein [Methylobacterium sp. C25]|uniref:cell envelope integrity EipB family protein n=1 Tax=Methylobacterium sp. C25 TaxID=2721622 RepID=UPI001F294E8B|nr:cell envelope integrity EipB family protein [Methylobacterium sp. C25]MCE4222262.1 cell envelope integrity EipB family protein [Methylobacterium sp. C25]
MRLRYATAFAFLASAMPAGAAPAQGAPATPADAPIRLANHRAVYDLSLAKSEGTRAVETAQGRIVIDFSGDACKGYTIQTRQVTILSSGETGERTSDLRNTTYETGDGKSLRFKTGAVLNNVPSPAIDGTAEASDEGVKVKLKEPKRDQYKVDGTVLFPSHHMLRLIEAARKGETTVAVKVFDGSDDGRKVYDTLAVIGRPSATPAAANTDRDKPLREGEMAKMRRWPVTLSYFTQGEGERTPIYTLSFDLYENGVSGAIHLDYGDFAIDGTVSRFDMAKADPKAEGECGK